MKIPSSNIKKIAVFRALQLGDMLCAIPALRTLHYAYPQAEITLLGLPWAASLMDRFPRYVHRFRHFPGYHGLPEQEFNEGVYEYFVEWMRGEQFDLVLQMQGNGTIVNEMMKDWGARHLAGFCLAEDAPDRDLFLTYPEGIHELERHLALMDFLGLPQAGKHMEFPLYHHDYAAYDALGLNLEAGSFVCVHPGSRGAWRQWPPEHFAALANQCADQGLRIVLTGTREETPIIQAVRRHIKADSTTLAGQTNLGAMAVLLKESALLISNCTGVSHIAAALEVPSVVISMDGEPERWGPLNKTLHHTIDWTRNPSFDAASQALAACVSIV